MNWMHLDKAQADVKDLDTALRKIVINMLTSGCSIERTPAFIQILWQRHKEIKPETVKAILSTGSLEFICCVWLCLSWEQRMEILKKDASAFMEVMERTISRGWYYSSGKGSYYLFSQHQSHWQGTGKITNALFATTLKKILDTMSTDEEFASLKLKQAMISLLPYSYRFKIKEAYPVEVLVLEQDEVRYSYKGANATLFTDSEYKDLFERHYDKIISQIENEGSYRTSNLPGMFERVLKKYHIKFQFTEKTEEELKKMKKEEE